MSIYEVIIFTGSYIKTLFLFYVGKVLLGQFLYYRFRSCKEALFAGMALFYQFINALGKGFLLFCLGQFIKRAEVKNGLMSNCIIKAITLTQPVMPFTLTSRFDSLKNHF